jgi:hypothetical protein
MAVSFYIIVQQNLLNICKIVYGTYGKVNLWPYIHQALLSINIAENLKYPTAFSASLYKISAVYGRCGKIHVWPYENQALLRIGIAKKTELFWQPLVKISYIKFQQYL